MLEPIRVVITGAAGQIGYCLSGMVARGDMFGPDQPLILVLNDILFDKDPLTGVKMELEDFASPICQKIIITYDPKEAFKDVDVAILVGAMPRKDGMERKDLLKANAKIFKEQGQYLNSLAKKSVKVLVVGNPANTNALILHENAPSLPKENITALTRLDHNRATSQIAMRLGVSCSDVKNCIIWGNHSNTQFVDVAHAVVKLPGGEKSVYAAVNDENWIRNDFLKTVQIRGSSVIKARGASSAVSAAKAIVDQMHDWWHGTPPGQWVSMSVYSDGCYGVPEGLIFSFPVEIKNKKWSIVPNLTMDSWAQTQFQKTVDELVEERKAAHSI